MPRVRIPQAMITEHVNWYARIGNLSQGGRAIPPGQPGSGEEFLVWHQDFIRRYRRWRRENGEPLIRAWNRIPAALGPVRPQWNPPNVMVFATLDAFGRFLESGVHIFLHDRAATVYNEPILTTFESPRSSYFWKLHGLMDTWRKRWLRAHS